MIYLISSQSYMIFLTNQGGQRKGGMSAKEFAMANMAAGSMEG
jgi:hypothetical protein|tara:strand:- start:66 stop:194 length:129 start_codon:yes stop_codon:yes gene_type:complete